MNKCSVGVVGGRGRKRVVDTIACAFWSYYGNFAIPSLSHFCFLVPLCVKQVVFSLLYSFHEAMHKVFIQCLIM